MFWLNTNKVVHRSDQNVFTGIFKTQPGCKSFTFTNRCTYLLVLESTKIYIKIHNKMLVHVSVCDHHQGARTWA
jgi:hypothetical protein